VVQKYAHEEVQRVALYQAEVSHSFGEGQKVSRGKLLDRAFSFLQQQQKIVVEAEATPSAGLRPDTTHTHCIACGLDYWTRLCGGPACRRGLRPTGMPGRVEELD
jgi:hypothetical protein